MTTQDFISKYKWAAIWNHVLYGIPASVTLAQAIIESSSGNSKLAINANNFFGIKAYSNPEGLPVYYANDDIEHEPFRMYPSASASFADHSKFLLDNKRYLTAIAQGNYVDFANELKAAGYATAPNYAQLIISDIEKYNLQQYDVYGNNKWLFLVLFIIVVALLIYLVYFFSNQ